MDRHSFLLSLLAAVMKAVLLQIEPLAAATFSDRNWPDGYVRSTSALPPKADMIEHLTYVR
jgi:hypothetical protein